jgi:hypothetical protein
VRVGRCAFSCITPPSLQGPQRSQALQYQGVGVGVGMGDWMDT